MLVKERDQLRARVQELEAANRDCVAHFDALKADYDALKAEREELEKQEPVAYSYSEDHNHHIYRADSTDDMQHIMTDPQYSERFFARPVPARSLTDADIDRLWFLSSDMNSLGSQQHIRKQFVRLVEKFLRGE